MQQQMTMFDEYQPRFQMFLDFKNASHKSEVKIYEFIVWISGLAEDFKRENKLTTITGNHKVFDKFISERVYN